MAVREALQTRVPPGGCGPRTSRAPVQRVGVGRGPRQGFRPRVRGRS